jgi:hypothetical protein
VEAEVLLEVALVFCAGAEEVDCGAGVELGVLEPWPSFWLLIYFLNTDTADSEWFVIDVASAEAMPHATGNLLR